MNRLQDLSTFDLAFNLAQGKYSEQEKFDALSIIKSREDKSATNASIRPIKVKTNKKPLKGSKAEKILNLYESGVNTAKEIQDALKKKKINAYFPEIYRVLKNYTDFEK
jgi:hypothetical protein